MYLEDCIFQIQKLQVGIRYICNNRTEVRVGTLVGTLGSFSINHQFASLYDYRLKLEDYSNKYEELFLNAESINMCEDDMIKAYYLIKNKETSEISKFQKYLDREPDKKFTTDATKSADEYIDKFQNIS